MLEVYFTVDVEVWCDGWHAIDQKFPDSFQRYIYGKTGKGDFGLPYKLKVLNDHGLQGVFFVEPLFSLRFGLEPLAEITQIILQANQSVELHMHTEWLDEANETVFPHIKEKRQHMRHFSAEEQATLVDIGKQQLSKAGVEKIHAFRAGSFGFNADTLPALKRAGIYIDSSYNATLMGPSSGLSDEILSQSANFDGVHEVPMTVYYDRPGHLRHTQLCACSSGELETVLWKSLEQEKREVVILSHNFELLDDSLSRPNSIVIKRFHKLCEFLERNQDCFAIKDFQDFSRGSNLAQSTPVSSPLWHSGFRMAQQAYSRIF